MLLGVVSDTHGHVSSTLTAIRMLESCAVDAVLHCGDVGSVEIVELFARWPAHFVLGNVDTQPARMRAAIEAAGHTCHGRFGELELAARRIAFLHGDDGKRLQEAIASGRYELVCYGHTHRAEQHWDGNTLVLNPGALYRAQPHSLALVRLATMDVAHVPL
jgi:putative phosphoesterase